MKARTTSDVPPNRRALARNSWCVVTGIRTVRKTVFLSMGCNHSTESVQCKHPCATGDEMRTGDWVKHPKIEAALYVVDVLDDGLLRLRAPSPDGWPYPVTLVMPQSDVRVVRPPKNLSIDDDFEEAPW